MGIFKKTTNRIFGSEASIAERLQKVFTPCLAGTGSKKVSIKLFDAKVLVGDVAPSGESVKNDLQLFLDNLKATVGLPASVKQNLETFSFEVAYFPRGPSSAERNSFGMMDFPIYLENTAPPNAISPAQAKDLLVAHRIPETTFVRTKIAVNQVQTAPVRPYVQVKEMFEDDNTGDLGIGIPGTYFAREDLHTRCRKLGIIEINLIKAFTDDLTTRRLFAVLKHELGHMFGLGHHPGTLMDEKVKVAIRPENSSYTIDHIEILTQALTLISGG
jgi:hypothetical protein